MEITSAQKAGQQYSFYPNGPERSRSFVVIPREMIDMTDMGHVKAKWSRVVAFGDLAEAINKLMDDGVTLFKIGKGRIRKNDLELDDGEILKSKEIVAKTLDMKGFTKLMNSKAIKGSGIYSGDEVPDAG